MLDLVLISSLFVSSIILFPPTKIVKNCIFQIMQMDTICIPAYNGYVVPLSIYCSGTSQYLFIPKSQNVIGTQNLLRKYLRDKKVFLVLLIFHCKMFFNCPEKVTLFFKKPSGGELKS